MPLDRTLDLECREEDSLNTTAQIFDLKTFWKFDDVRREWVGLFKEMCKKLFGRLV